ncbi:uncharacterized protein LOC118432774 [Branchiostoma floridae]|uniref:Uncharacterized protein LOC118432774 n=1 Tax=Branchiostoma floridae TaxID=7739 RepID=A0A9J7MFI5_BRAFL|nr:uncharacterized protein LOC118432774 [Branchiostoma floridae]
MTATSDEDQKLLQAIDSKLQKVIEEAEERARKIVEKGLKDRDGKITEQRKKDIKTMTKEFCTTTTAHGISRVAEANTVRSRIIWTAILISCVTLFVYQAAILIKAYFEYPVNVDIKVVDNNKLTFPSVTVCNNNRLRRSMLRGTRHGALLELDERTENDTRDYLRGKRDVPSMTISTTVEHDPIIIPMYSRRLQVGYLTNESTDASTECRRQSQQLCTLTQLLRAPEDDTRSEWSYFSQQGWAAKLFHQCNATGQHDTCDTCYNNKILLRRVDDITAKINSTLCCKPDSYVKLTNQTFETHIEALESSACANLVGDHGLTSTDWSDYVDEYGEVVLFCGHVNGNGYNFQHLSHPVLTSHVAILPRSNGQNDWGNKNMRVEFLGCEETDCIFGIFLHPVLPTMNMIDPSSISCSSKDCVTNVTTYCGTVRSSGNDICQDWACPNRYFDYCLEENFCRFAPNGDHTNLVCPSASGSQEANLTSAPCQSIAKCSISENDDEPIFPTRHGFYQQTYAAQYCEERGKQLCSLEQLVLLNAFKDVKATEWGWIGDKDMKAIFEEDCTNSTSEFCFKNNYRYRVANEVRNVAYCCDDSLFRLTEKTYHNHSSAEKGCRDQGMQLCLPSQLLAIHGASIRRDRYPEDLAWINMADKVALLNDTCGCNVGERCVDHRFPLYEINHPEAYKALCCEESFLLSQDQFSNQLEAFTVCNKTGKQTCSRPQLNDLYNDGVRNEDFSWFSESHGVARLQGQCNTSDPNCNPGVTYKNVIASNDTAFSVYCCKPDSVKTPSNQSIPKRADITNHFMGCNNPLGMESGVILRDQIRTSSIFDQKHSPNHARLNSVSSWKMAENDTTPWIQVDLLDSHMLAGVIIQGGGKDGGYVSSFSLSFSIDGDQWQMTNLPTLFVGNKDGQTPNHVYFPRAVATRYVQLHPRSWKRTGGVRLELVGCRSSSCAIARKTNEKGVQFYHHHQAMCAEPECIVGRGLNYRGKQNVTRSGRPCQKWNSHDPQDHCTTPSLYPDADLSENYCRNIPDHPSKAPWCFTGEQDWEYCHVERCEVGCVDLKLNSVGGENDWDGFLLSSNTDDYTDITDFSMATREEIAEMGHQKEDLILQCTFDKERCSLDDFKVTQNAKYGNCFTFNHGEDDKVRTTTKVGAEFGLKLTLSIESDEYVGLFGQDPGAKVTIHSVGSTPFPEGNALNTKPGESTFVGLKRSSVKRQPHPYGDCTSYQERDELYGGRYTYETCQHSCLQAALLDKCGCSDELIVINSTLCSVLNKTQECCRQEVRKRHEDGNLLCNCRQSCEEDSYALWLSSSLWPSDRYVWYVLENIHTRSRARNLPLSPDELRQNLARVHVYFRDLNYELINENPTYTEETLLSGLGGLLGLYVGLSVITVFEFINLVVDVVKVACKKERKDKGNMEPPVIMTGS